MNALAIAEPRVSCAQCDAVCCRLTVVLDVGDALLDGLETTDATGLRVMRRSDDGWCAALDRDRMCCSIYESRPAACRRFRMGGGYCRAIRDDYARDQRLAISCLLI